MEDVIGERIGRVEEQIKRLVSDAVSEKHDRRTISRINSEKIDALRTDLLNFKTEVRVALLKSEWTRTMFAGLVGSMPAAIALIWFLITKT